MSERYCDGSELKCKVADALDRVREDRDFRRQDIRLLIIALNLSGKRAELEDRAATIMEEHGPIKALDVSLTTSERI